MYLGKYMPKSLPGAGFRFSALQTHDRGTLLEGGGEEVPDEISWSNKAIGFRYVLLPKSVSVSTDFRVHYARYDSDLGPPGDPKSAVLHLAYRRIPRCIF